MTEEQDKDLHDSNPNKLEEYFQTKETLKTLRSDLKTLKEEHSDFKELEELNKQVKGLREKINNDENVRTISDKIATLKERITLLKEIIKIELKETEATEVKMNGRKLKIVEVLKEVKDEE